MEAAGQKLFIQLGKNYNFSDGWREKLGPPKLLRLIALSDVTSRSNDPFTTRSKSQIKKCCLKIFEGSQFVDFFRSPKKIWRYGGEQLDGCTHWTKGVKNKSHNRLSRSLIWSQRMWYWLPCCAPTFLRFDYLVQSGHLVKWVSPQVGHLILSERFGQTKIDNLATCLEIGIIGVLSFYQNFTFEAQRFWSFRCLFESLCRGINL